MSDPSDPLGRALAELAHARWADALARERVAVLRECRARLADGARAWVADACASKRIPSSDAVAAEEIGSGPLAVVRALRLLERAWTALAAGRLPDLPRPPRADAAGATSVRVFPVPWLGDRLLFPGFSAKVRLGGATAQRRPAPRHGTCLVLGAGNASSLPVCDSLSKLFDDPGAVLLKVHPLHDVLVPHFERVLAPLIACGALRVVTGDASVGARAVADPRVGAVHVTGARATHDAIVAELARRAASDVADTPVTSELGNVTPVVILPGRWREADLRHHAANVASMIAHNASFHCVAAKVLVTWRGWPQRARFLELLARRLQAIPRRAAFYPGARERFARFSGGVAVPDDGTLPWTLRTGVTPDEAPELFAEESFVCVTAETALEAEDARHFLERAVAFVDERVAGNLAACVIAPPDLRRADPAGFARAIARLRYGTVAINHWPGVAYALMTTPWGAFPGGTLAAPRSGVGFVHDPWLLNAPVQTVFEGPFRAWPTPPWFVGRPRAHEVLWALFDLWARGDRPLRRMLRVAWSALRGA